MSNRIYVLFKPQEFTLMEEAAEKIRAVHPEWNPKCENEMVLLDPWGSFLAFHDFPDGFSSEYYSLYLWCHRSHLFEEKFNDINKYVAQVCEIFGSSSWIYISEMSMDLAWECETDSQFDAFLYERLENYNTHYNAENGIFLLADKDSHF